MRLFFLFLFLFALPLARATPRMAQRAELAASVVACYTGVAPALWDAFVGALAPEVVADVDLLAGKAALLREMLRDRVAPCTAIERVTRRRLPHCPPLESVNLGPLRLCLGMAQATGRGSFFDPPDRERAAAANARMWSTREEALTYGTDPDAYSDPMVRSVVAAVKRQHAP
jgi:hypothetical protein